MSALPVVRALLRKAWPLLTLATLALLATVAVDLAAPWPFKFVVDHVLLGKPAPAAHSALLAPALQLGAAGALAMAAAAIALLALLGGACAYLQTFLTARIGQDIAHDLRVRVFETLLRMPLAFHRGERSGELVNRVASDAMIVRDAFADWAIKACGDVLLILGVVVVMLLLHPGLALLVGVLLPALYLVLRGLTREIRRLARNQRKKDGQLAARMQELLQSVALVQAFGATAREQSDFEAQSRRSAVLGIVSARVGALVSRSVALVAALATASIVWFGGRQVLQGELTPGDLLLFVAYVTALFKPLRDLGKLWAKFARARVSLERLNEVLTMQPPPETGELTLDPASVCGRLVFEQVAFEYAPGRAVLRDFNLCIEPGEHVALLGPSGAGKSSLVQLLVRLHEPAGGRVLLDGVPLSAYRRDAVRAAIGVVLQESMFVGVTVRDHLCYGLADVPHESVLRAAQLAHAHEFISQLPNGYDTVLGEQSRSLSGGQRQRLALARSLLRDPPVLVLDEPTSAVDAESAIAIAAALRESRRGRTTIVIGHQFTGFDGFDRVIELTHSGARDITGEIRQSTVVPLRAMRSAP
jgi:ATP-binding cassette subfamily B protein